MPEPTYPAIWDSPADRPTAPVDTEFEARQAVLKFAVEKAAQDSSYCDAHNQYPNHWTS